MNERLVKEWLERASEDLVVARLVLSEDHTAHACFLSQQTIEKSLKAYLIARINYHPRIHQLPELLHPCEALAPPTFIQFEPDCIRIDEYYVPTRYPTAVPGSLPGGMPSFARAEEAIAAAGRIPDFVTQQISAADWQDRP